MRLTNVKPNTFQPQSANIWVDVVDLISISPGVKSMFLWTTRVSTKAKVQIAIDYSIRVIFSAFKYHMKITFMKEAIKERNVHGKLSPITPFTQLKIMHIWARKESGRLCTRKSQLGRGMNLGGKVTKYDNRIMASCVCSPYAHRIDSNLLN